MASDDLVKSRDAIAELQRTSYGWMGRTPDYKGAFLGTLGANCEFYGDYKQNALNWYAKAQERLDYWNHAIVHPPIDRGKAIEDIRDVIIHVEKETDAGLIVSGAKVVVSSRKQDVCDHVTKEINDKFGNGTAVAASQPAISSRSTPGTTALKMLPERSSLTSTGSAPGTRATAREIWSSK